MNFYKKTFSLFFFLSLAFWSGGVSATGMELVLSVSSSTPEMKKPFDVILEIQKTGEEMTIAQRAIEIPGIENFAQVGTSNATSIESINGKTRMSTQIKKTLLPSQVGNFTFGPVEVSVKDETGKESVLKSNTVSVQVQPGKGGTSSTIQPPQTLGDDSDFFQEVPPAPTVEILPTGNIRFWIQVSSIAFLLWAFWFFVNHKIEQKKKRREEWISPPKTTPSPENLEKEKEGISEKEKEEKSLDLKFPLPEDPDFWDKIQKIIADFCREKWALDPAKITQSEILPQAEKYLSPDSFQQLQEILKTYQKARFAKLPIDRKVFVDRLELFLRKHF